MTTLQSQTTHNKVARTLRHSGYKATCVRNNNFEANEYEVKIKGISQAELKELYNVIFSLFNNTMINLITE